ncbi:MAG: ribonuclease HI family protein [Gemmataceae bacterium]|nr:ribonuclease HI family protein [Gemmataceae bacterium]
MDAPFLIHTDGASRANPGPAAFSYVIERPGEPDITEMGRLRDTTNNVAEYTAMIRALDHAIRIGGRKVVLRSDSELMVQQMSGKYKVKNEGLLPLYRKACSLVAKLESVKFEHVRREYNKRADALCNEALDSRAPFFPLPTEDAEPSAAKPPIAPAKPAGDETREKALAYLKDAVQAWVDEGDEKEPSPEAVLDRLWEMFREAK